MRQDRKLEELIVTGVLGWTTTINELGDTWYLTTNKVPVSPVHFKPSIDIGSALQVLNHIQKQGHSIELHSFDSDKWICWIDTVCSAAATLPMAICLAVRKALIS